MNEKNKTIDAIVALFKKKYVFRRISKNNLQINGFDEVNIEVDSQLTNFYKEIYTNCLTISISDFSELFKKLMENSEENVRYYTALILSELNSEIKKNQTIISELYKKEKSNAVKAHLSNMLFNIERENKENVIALYIEALNSESKIQRKIELSSVLIFFDPEKTNPYAIKVLQELLESEELEVWQKQLIQLYNVGILIKQFSEPIIEIGKAVKDFFANLLTGRLFRLNLEQMEQLHIAVKNTQRIIDYFQDYPLSQIEIDELKTKYNTLLNIDCSQIQDKEKYGLCKTQKGIAFEEFCVSFFSKATGIILLDKNRNFEYEEIDIIFENNSREPFFMNLQSPLIFVECKNWFDKVGKDQAEIFANRLHKRKGTTKLGIFIALNGVKESFHKEIEDIQKEGFTIALVTKEHFDDFFNKQPYTILKFLKDRILETLK